jgi:RES domain-containing protein
MLDSNFIKVVQPDDVPNPNWLIPSAVTRHSWNLLVSGDLAADQFQLVSQERFGLDTRLLK